MIIDRSSAIIVGGASGLGAACVKRLAKCGACISIFDINEIAGASIAKEIGAEYFRVDISNEIEIIKAFERSEKKFGTARILINCAGVSIPAKVVDREGRALSLTAMRKTIDVNLLGTMRVASEFSARLIKQEYKGEEAGVIVNTASVAAFDGQIGQSVYAASKAAIAGITLPLARELALHGVRVVSLAPGLFETPLLSTLSKTALNSLAQQIPFPQRPGKPEEFAQLVESVLRNPMINGETIRIDGAIRMAPR